MAFGELQTAILVVAVYIPSFCSQKSLDNAMKTVAKRVKTSLAGLYSENKAQADPSSKPSRIPLSLHSTIKFIWPCFFGLVLGY